jgi:hypothetical protein
MCGQSTIISKTHLNPAFNADEVDAYMLQRLPASIDSGDIQIISMNAAVGKVLRELMAGMRLAGCPSQHSAFKFLKYRDPNGNRRFAGHSKGSVSFQLDQTAQLKISEGKVPGPGSSAVCALH